MSLPVFAYYGARRGWIVIPERLRESKIDYSQPTTALVGALDSLSDFKEMLKWFDIEETAELRTSHRLLWDNDSDAHKKRSTLSVVRSAISSILGDTFHSPRFNAKHKFVISSKSGPEELQVSQLSQGYQSMLALAMDFARRLAIANGHLHLGDDSDAFNPLSAPAIMLVDEIDLHLHPSWQQRVLADLMRTFPRTQFIVTSHSPQVLSTVPSESIRIIQDGAIYASPPGTDGAEVQRILEDVFHVSPRPKTAMSDALNEYLRLVDARQWESDRALELRRKLDEWSQGNEPSLLEADLQIENMKWESGQ